MHVLADGNQTLLETDTAHVLVVGRKILSLAHFISMHACNLNYYRHLLIIYALLLQQGLQCFDAVGWAAGRASGL